MRSVSHKMSICLNEKLSSPLSPFPRWQLLSVRTGTFNHLINARNSPIFIPRLSPAAVELRDEGLEAAAGLVLALLLHHEGVTLTRVPVTCTLSLSISWRSLGDRINLPNITYFLIVSSFKIAFLAFNSSFSFVFKSTLDMVGYKNIVSDSNNKAAELKNWKIQLIKELVLCGSYQCKLHWGSCVHNLGTL